jgi:hypothetical protein
MFLIEYKFIVDHGNAEKGVGIRGRTKGQGK